MSKKQHEEVTVQIPRKIFEDLQQQAKIREQSFEEVVVEALAQQTISKNKKMSPKAAMQKAIVESLQDYGPVYKKLANS